MSDLRIIVRDFLNDYVRKFQWPIVKYDANNRPYLVEQTFDPRTNTTNPLVRSCDADEISSQFTPDDKDGRQRSRKRLSWTWDLTVAFACEVDINQFEKSITKPVLFIPSSQTYGNGQVTFHLTRTNVTHPPRQSPSTGTTAKFTLEVEPART